ncbi:MAG: ABC transporter permease [Deltaproteobacteria bacterium]|nr:ABC transporter permease [Deltaproteobacteria bacterium]
MAYPVGAIIGVLLLWQAATALLTIPPYILPSPLKILLRMGQRAGLLLGHTWVTTYEILLGYACSLVLGGAFAVLVVVSPTLDRALMPLFLLSQTVSKIAIAPLFVIWLGFGLPPKIAVSFLISFFPVFISTATGLKAVEADMLDLIRSMSPKPWHVFTKVRIPAALPFFFSGARIAMPFATIGAIVGEWIASDRGLGYYLLVAQGDLDTPLLFATILVISAVGAILYAAISKAERALLPWHVAVRQGEQAMLTV